MEFRISLKTIKGSQGYSKFYFSRGIVSVCVYLKTGCISEGALNFRKDLVPRFLRLVRRKTSRTVYIFIRTKKKSAYSCLNPNLKANPPSTGPIINETFSHIPLIYFSFYRFQQHSHQPEYYEIISSCITFAIQL